MARPSPGADEKDYHPKKAPLLALVLAPSLTACAPASQAPARCPNRTGLGGFYGGS